LITNNSITAFLSQYDDQVIDHVFKLREILLENLPGIIEQIDIPAKMIAYCYGEKYSDMICTVIPSKKGLKLGFYKGNELPDPNQLLQGSGKISRYIQINSADQIKSADLKKILLSALIAYQQRSAVQK
jgi:hypothetical protein